MDRRENDSLESHEAKVSELSRAYAGALLRGDEIEAEVAVREAMAAKLSTAEIDDEIIAPALWLVGELWERGEISVADEHIATEISIRVLALQREAQRVAQARGVHRVMLAAPAGELHVVALRMIGNLLRDAGYHVVMLGADVPTQALAGGDPPFVGEDRAQVRAGGSVAGVEQRLQPRDVLGRLIHGASLIRATYAASDPSPQQRQPCLRRVQPCCDLRRRSAGIANLQIAPAAGLTRSGRLAGHRPRLPNSREPHAL